jgi:hypothetical protein
MRGGNLLLAFAWILAVVVFNGCSNAPSRVSAPSWDPEGFADAVLTKLDKNGDKSLDKAELAGAPGLAWGAAAIDTDKNGSLSRDELVARFAIYKKMRIGVTTTQVRVVYKGQALTGGKLTLVPEFFLEGLVEPATSELMSDGYAMPRVEGLDPPGLRVGYYRAVVESPKVKIPAKYNSAESTPVGFEVSPVQDIPSADGMQLILRD